MSIRGIDFPVLVLDKPGHWIKFSNWSNETSWDMVTEEDMVAVADWCREHDCGARMSYDMFQFRNKKELEFFMLMWA